MSAARVFVRGVGAITALGASWPASLGALADGRAAVGPVRAFDVTNFPSTVAAAIDGFVHTGDRRLALARVAAREAWTDAGFHENAPPPQRTGIFLGAESGRAPFATLLGLTRAAGGGARFDHRQFGANAAPLAAQFDASIISPAAVTSALAREFDAQGPAVTISLACASGASAIAEAARAIRLGVCDVAICGGVGADVDPMMLAGFGRIGALTARGLSCPFDVRRDGFAVGEGAAIVILSREQGAASVEVAGEGRSLDAHHLTAPDPEGEGAARSMRAALKSAGIDAVDYVQAHGTSTPLNDAVEALALQRVLGPHLERAHVSSVKGALGHWIAGAGALGFLCAHAAVAHGLVLPTAHLREPDPACALPHVFGRALRKTVDAALVNAFAFGGANCSIVARRCA
ncbi:beta-ketoacyl-[acyl-carrier-protein] synthase family protein [Massilia sp. TSP1-1-2]|uniref:beta-ketoacyl-[acyl-carrier-protein] synthase family protein n=1 Tax=unclassified Massilia TaxID=2609279 RepID=UPI003CE94F13